MTSPTNGQAFPAGSDITLQATASDPDGTVAKVEFYQGSTKLGESISAPYSFTWSQVPAGSYHFIARAIDDLGGTTDSSIASVQVGSQAGHQPHLGNGSIVGGHFQFTLQSDAAAVLRIQQSSDLVNWTVIGSITNLTGTVSFQDPSAVTSPAKFYRALLQ